MKSVKIWFCELCGMIQVPSSGASSGHEESSSNPSQQNSNKIEPSPSHSWYVLGILNSICYYMWLFFPFSFIMESYLGRGQRVVSLCFLSTNQTGPAWGQTSLEFAVRTAVPGLCLSVQPHDFGLDPCLPEPHVPHLWEQDDPHDLTRANMPWPED